MTSEEYCSNCPQKNRRNTPFDDEVCEQGFQNQFCQFIKDIYFLFEDYLQKTGFNKLPEELISKIRSFHIANINDDHPINLKYKPQWNKIFSEQKNIKSQIKELRDQVKKIDTVDGRRPLKAKIKELKNELEINGLKNRELLKKRIRKCMNYGKLRLRQNYRAVIMTESFISYYQCLGVLLIALIIFVFYIINKLENKMQKAFKRIYSKSGYFLYQKKR